MSKAQVPGTRSVRARAFLGPAEPASASPTGSIFNRPAQLVNRHRRRVAAFSTGTVRDFQPELTLLSPPNGKRQIPHS